MDAGVILEYFAPLRARLDRQNAGQLVGCEQGAQTNRGWRGGTPSPRHLRFAPSARVADWHDAERALARRQADHAG